MSLPVSRCDCCSLPIDPQAGESCPRCGYPVDAQKEIQFLTSALHDLQRVTTYGGAQITITQLIQRYQHRLNDLRHPFSIPSETSLPLEVQKLQPTQPTLPPTQQPVLQPAPAPVAAAVVPEQLFSFKTFFTDQAINIVAALGAFLLLIGSVSFIATTTDRRLSFPVLLIVHAFFGIIGVTSYRFRNFRVVAAIYTAIFALQVPLVGFAGYQLLSGDLLYLSTPTLIAVSALYAAVVYGALAIYQKFQPFGYLAVAALVVTDLALATAYHAGFWWWPSMLMLLAFPALLTCSNSPRAASPFQGPLRVLRDPVRHLMNICVSLCGLSIIVLPLYSLMLDVLQQPSQDVRFSIIGSIVLMIVWPGLFAWRTQRFKCLFIEPYLVSGCVVACAYAFHASTLGYVLALTSVALFYHGLDRLVQLNRLKQPLPLFWQYISNCVSHMRALVLILVGIVPLIVAPLLPLQLFEQEYAPATSVFHVTWETNMELALMGVGLLLTLSVIVQHTGTRRILVGKQAAWPWLLLFSGFLLYWIYGLLLLTMHAEPFWGWPGLTLAFVLATLLVRRQMSAAWAGPLDVLALVTAGQTLLSGLNPWPDRPLILLLAFAALSYAIALYQRRQRWLFLPLVFVALALPELFVRPQVLLIISTALPLAGVVIQQRMQQIAADVQPRPRQTINWEWPLIVSGLVSGIAFSWHDITTTSTLQNWLHIPFPVALEMAVLSLVWYVSAGLTRIKWWLVFVVGFAVAALLMPTNPPAVLNWLAPLLAVLAWDIRRMAGRHWALPLYIIAVFAAVMMGRAGYHGGQIVPETVLALLIFAVLIYLMGIIENEPLLMWIAPSFAVWSVYYSIQLGDFSRLPLVTLTCVALGLGINSLKLFVPALPGSIDRERLLRYTLPLYITACATAVLTGMYGLLKGANTPLPTTLPYILFVYALVASGVVLFARRPELIFVPFALVAWAIAQATWPFWQQMLAYSVLCTSVFVAQFVWQKLPPATQTLAVKKFYSTFAIVAQACGLLLILAQGGLSTNTGVTAHVGAEALAVLALLLFWSGRLQETQALQRQSVYTAGFLFSLVIAWELRAFQHSSITLLALAPATYLIVLAPFISCDEVLSHHHRLGQTCSIIGATLLLLPTLWLSFNQTDALLYTLILSGEALALLLIGVATWMRVFILSGAGLIIVSALHILFLPSLGIPTFLALTLMGGLLLALATALILVRPRLAFLWSESQ